MKAYQITIATSADSDDVRFQTGRTCDIRASRAAVAVHRAMDDYRRKEVRGQTVRLWKIRVVELSS